MVATTHTIKLTDFTATPGGRYREYGPYSGEEWAEDYLIPAFREDWQTIIVDLDGAYGLPIGFIDEAFYMLGREYGYLMLRERLRIQCLDDFTAIYDVVGAIKARCGERMAS